MALGLESRDFMKHFSRHLLFFTFVGVKSKTNKIQQSLKLFTMTGANVKTALYP